MRLLKLELIIFLIRFRLSSTLKRPKTPMKTEPDFRKRFQKWRYLKTYRFENAPFQVWTGEKGDF